MSLTAKEIVLLILPHAYASKEICNFCPDDCRCGFQKQLDADPNWSVLADNDEISGGNDTEDQAWDDALTLIRENACRKFGYSSYEEAVTG